MTKSIYILSGPVHSGKTTTLINWMEKRNDVGGIITPVINSKRFFMDVATGEKFDMEAADEEMDTLRIGRYVFSKNAFERAIGILHKSLSTHHGWLVLDEVGPLEMAGKGFHDVVRQLLEQATRKLKLIFVVRENLVKDFIRIFQIDDDTYKVVDVTSEIFD